MKAAEFALSEGIHNEVSVEVKLTGDGADKATVGPVKTKSSPTAPSVGRGRTGSQR